MQSEGSVQPAVLLIVFNRPDTALRVLQSIRTARPERLYIAADGSRADRPGEDALCGNVRSSVLRAVDWKCDVKTLFQTDNLGCAEGVAGAITWFFSHEEEGIILEDDCCPLPSFFPFCEEMLERYRHDERIGLISGDNFQNGKVRGSGSYYFSGVANIWGWATWRRAWKDYLLDIRKLAAREEVAGAAFGRWGRRDVADYWGRMYDAVAVAKPMTWDYQWAMALMLKNRLQVVPNSNLVENVGFDERATHTKSAHNHTTALMRTRDIAFPLSHPGRMEIDLAADRYYFCRVCLVGWGGVIERVWLRCCKLFAKCRQRMSWRYNGGVVK